MAFTCFQQNAVDITFRARLHAANEEGVVELIDDLRDWASEGPVVVVGGVLLRIDPNCDIVIASFSSPVCTVGDGRSLTPDSPTEASKNSHGQLDRSHVYQWN
jgi:hypothetical protein